MSFSAFNLFSQKLAFQRTIQLNGNIKKLTDLSLQLDTQFALVSCGLVPGEMKKSQIKIHESISDGKLRSPHIKSISALHWCLACRRKPWSPLIIQYSTAYFSATTSSLNPSSYSVYS
jgi:hypothetical protein